MHGGAFIGTHLSGLICRGASVMGVCVGVPRDSEGGLSSVIYSGEVICNSQFNTDCRCSYSRCGLKSRKGRILQSHGYA